VTDAPPIPTQEQVSERVRLETERALKRNIKGLDFLLADRQPVGAMEKELLHRDGTATFYRYKPILDEIYRVPLVIVTPPSNKGYIFDLAKGQSFVEFMLERGYDVFVLDWSVPRREESGLGLADYADRFISDAIAKVVEVTGETQISLAGYCMGGVLATAHAALYPDGPVKNLIAFATPVDFSEMKMFQVWADKRHFDVDALADQLGIVPGDIMLGAFDLARPANRVAGQMNLWTNMWNDDYVQSYRMFDRWAAETLPIPAEYFREQIKDLMWDNAFCKNEWVLGGKKVDLRNIKIPILNIVAVHDHVVSHAATQPLMNGTGSDDCEEIISKGGHVSLVAGPAAVRRLWPLIDAWLGKRSV
jgi:polyhydroxyalkanoate synthase subunit PhaC